MDELNLTKNYLHLNNEMTNDKVEHFMKFVALYVSTLAKDLNIPTAQYTLKRSLFGTRLKEVLPLDKNETILNLVQNSYKNYTLLDVLRIVDDYSMSRKQDKVNALVDYKIRYDLFSQLLLNFVTLQNDFTASNLRFVEEHISPDLTKVSVGPTSVVQSGFMLSEILNKKLKVNTKADLGMQQDALKQIIDNKSFLFYQPMGQGTTREQILKSVGVEFAESKDLQKLLKQFIMYTSNEIVENLSLSHPNFTVTSTEKNIAEFVYNHQVLSLYDKCKEYLLKDEKKTWKIDQSLQDKTAYFEHLSSLAQEKELQLTK